VAAQKSRNLRLSEPFSHVSPIRPGLITQILYAPTTEKYLASMLVRSSTPEEMYEMVGAPTDPISPLSIGKEMKSYETDSKVGRKKQK
jgi:hypothetical protein